MTTLGERGPSLRALREQVTEAIEPLRRDKVVGSSLEAEVTLSRSRPMPDADLAELFIVSTVTRGEALRVTKTDDAQMRPLLAAAARSRRGRRPVRPLRGWCVNGISARSR